MASLEGLEWPQANKIEAGFAGTDWLGVSARARVFQ